MSHLPCPSPIAFESLVGYWLDDLDEPQVEQIEEHFLGCDACAAELRAIVGLERGIRACAEGGGIGAIVTEAFVTELSARGLRIREYRVPRNGSVQCTIAPDDQFLISRLELPLVGVERLDLEWQGDPGFAGHRLDDVPFDVGSGQLLLANHVTAVRALPKATGRLHAIAVDADQRRVIGEYTFHHTPWPGAS